MKSKYIVAVFMILTFSSSVFGDLYFTTPPISLTANQLKEINTLTKEISLELGEQIIYKNSNNWLDYTKYLRSDTYDMILSEAHIASWVLKSGHTGIEHKPLVRAKGTRNSVIIANIFDSTKNSIRDIKSICVAPSPSLDAVQLYRKIASNPVSQPAIREVNGGYHEISQMVIEKKCQFGVVSESFLSDKTNFKVIEKLPETPGMVLTFSTKLSPNTQEFLKNSLNKPEIKLNVIRLFKIYNDDNNTELDLVNSSEYLGFSSLLEQVWGW